MDDHDRTSTGDGSTSQDPPAPEPPVPPAGKPVAPGDKPAPFALEAESPEPCPNCGAPLHGGEALVCLRCGFDLKTLDVIETETGVDEHEPETPPAPISTPGRGGPALAGTIVVACLLLLLVGHALGMRGLYPKVEPGLTIANAERVASAGRAVALVGVWTLGALGALVALTVLVARPLGDVRLVLLRLAAIVVVVRLVTVIDLGPAPLEISVEMVLQAGLFGLGLLAFFAISLHDALVTMAMTIIAVVGIWLLGVVVTTIGVV
jgi:hypothetical protein